MKVRVVLSIEIDAGKWAQESDCALGEVRGQVCASVVNCVQSDLDDYNATVKEVMRV